jgi:uncharacterized protein
MMVHITASASLYPTEDPEKVRQALLNLFPAATITSRADGLTAEGDDGETLRQAIIDQHIRDTARSVMLRGRRDGSVRMTLSKQVAFIGKVSFVDTTVPLGGIEVVVEDEDIEAAIDHLAESTVEASE